MDGKGVTADGIAEGLRGLGVGAGGRIFVHSSLRSLGHVEGGAEAVCAALRAAVGPEGTVAVPAFTWGANHDKETVTFDVARDPCREVGIVPDTFRRLPEARRSEHVCHSMAAVGPLAGDLMGDAVSPFGPGSSLHRLYGLDFTLVFLGCGLSSCTSLHTVEELAEVPYRYWRHFEGSVVVRPDGTRAPSRAREFLRYLPFRNDFSRAERAFEERGILRRGRVAGAAVILASVRDVVDAGLERVRADAGFLLSEPSRACLARWDGPAARPTPLAQEP